MPRDPLPQRPDAEQFRIGQPSAERGARGRDGGRRRRRRGLAHLHVHDPAAGLLDPGRGRHNVHHHERRNIAAAGSGKQPFCSIEHH